jgi:hypothetical protein
MKGKRRQEVIQDILRTYGSVDHVDAICLGVRFHVDAETITEDIRRAKEALKAEAIAQQRAARLERERKAELERDRRIFRSGG